MGGSFFFWNFTQKSRGWALLWGGLTFGGVGPLRFFGGLGAAHQQESDGTLGTSPRPPASLPARTESPTPVAGQPTPAARPATRARRSPSESVGPRPRGSGRKGSAAGVSPEGGVQEGTWRRWHSGAGGCFTEAHGRSFAPCTAWPLGGPTDAQTPISSVHIGHSQILLPASCFL